MTARKNHHLPSQGAVVMAVAAILTAGGAQAQTSAPVDAGKSLDALKQAPSPLPQGKALSLPSDLRAKLSQGGKQVRVSSIRFQGNDHVSQERLLAGLGVDALGESPIDLAALLGLVDQTTQLYRSLGYPFAKAFLLAGSLRGEVLTITVVEGRYGQVKAMHDDEALAQRAQQYLAELKSGEVVRAQDLERAALLLGDLPGVSATPVMKPGADVGLGDLNVILETGKRWAGSVSIDNGGSAYTGEVRALARLKFNQMLTLGDELTVTAQAPTPGAWLGDLGYSLPVGSDGMRLAVGRALTGYELSDEFKGFKGTAAESRVGLSYPVLRSRMSNFTVSPSYSKKRLVDDRLGELDSKLVESLPLTLSFDHRDSVGQGGVTYGSFVWVWGRVSAGQAQTRFQRWALDVARVQRLNANWTLYGHLVAQGARDNLVSSEGFSLGGASAVRAYPSGEAAGDTGWLAQIEARRALGDVQAYVFYDHGQVRVDARPDRVLSPAADMSRAGAGIGVRKDSGPLRLDFSMAWRTNGGAPSTTVGSDPKPRVLMSAQYAF